MLCKPLLESGVLVFVAVDQTRPIELGVRMLRGNLLEFQGESTFMAAQHMERAGTANSHTLHARTWSVTADAISLPECRRNILGGNGCHPHPVLELGPHDPHAAGRVCVAVLFGSLERPVSVRTETARCTQASCGTSGTFDTKKLFRGCLNSIASLMYKHIAFRTAKDLVRHTTLP